VDAPYPRAAIQVLCQQRGWIAEWYHDTQDRSRWQMLLTRLGDSDIVALVVCRPTHISRHFTDFETCLEALARHYVTLAPPAPENVAVYPAENVRRAIQFVTEFEQQYTAELSQRIRISLAFRKRQMKA
jgi:hypothetical protein